MTNLVEVNNEQVVTTSIMVAETFGKQHKNVMRDIEGFLPNSYFVKSKHTHPQNNQTYPMYHITKEGFLLLTSSYRGKGVLEKKAQILSGTDMIPPSLPERKETEFFLELSQSLKGFKEDLTLCQQYNVLEYKVDGYIKELNLVIEYDESYHIYTEKEDSIRKSQIEKALNCKFLRLSSENTNAKNIGLVFGEMFKIMKEEIKLTNELTLLTQEKFGDVLLDTYRNENNEVFMTAKQLGEALGYAKTQAIINIVNRHDRLKKEEFSVVQKIESTDKKKYNTRLFNVNGIRAILQLSDVPLSRKMPLLKYFGEDVYYPMERDEHKYLQVIMDTFRDKETKREHVLGDYRADLIFPNEKVLIECDEYGHRHYCQESEKERELFFERQGYTIIRFNPNEKNFRIGLVIAEILDVFKNKGVL